MADVLAAAVARPAGGARRRRSRSPSTATTLRFTEADGDAARAGTPGARRLAGCTTRPARRSPRRSSTRLAQKYADQLGADVRGGAQPARRRRPRRAAPRGRRRARGARADRPAVAAADRRAAARATCSPSARAAAPRPPRAGPTPTGRCCCARPVAPLDAGRRAAAGRGRRAARRRRLRRAGRRRRRDGSAGAGTPRRPSTCCTARARRTPRPRTRPRSCPPFDLLDAEGWPSARRSATPRTTAERAAADRTWTYGHVIVDEAQELSAMAWRLLLRRCPTRSMTRGRRRRADRLAGRRASWARGARPRTSAAAGGWRS